MLNRRVKFRSLSGSSYEENTPTSDHALQLMNPTEKILRDLPGMLKKSPELEEVVVRRLTALEIADSRGGRKEAWKLACHFESALTTDRIVVDPAAMRHARNCLKLDRAGDRPSSDSDAESQAGRKAGGRGRGGRG